MPRSLPAVVFLVLLAGCAADPNTPPPPAAASAPSASAPVDDPPGALTCTKIVHAVRDATLMNPGAVTDVVDAAGTADAPVLEAAQRLSAAYTKAVAAHDTDDEPDAIAAVSAAAAQMVTVCGDSGLETVG